MTWISMKKKTMKMKEKMDTMAWKVRKERPVVAGQRPSQRRNPRLVKELAMLSQRWPRQVNGMRRYVNAMRTSKKLCIS